MTSAEAVFLSLLLGFHVTKAFFNAASPVYVKKPPLPPKIELFLTWHLAYILQALLEGLGGLQILIFHGCPGVSQGHLDWGQGHLDLVQGHLGLGQGHLDLGQGQESPFLGLVGYLCSLCCK